MTPDIIRRLFSSLILASLVAAGLAPEAHTQTPLGTFTEVPRPTSILVLDDGRVLIDTNPGPRPLSFAPDGTALGEFHPGGSTDSPLVQLADGRILITDVQDIVMFAPDATYLGIFAEGLNSPVAAVQLADGRVLVVENGTTGSGRVSAYAPDGTRLGTFARDSERPVAIAQLADGRVLVTYNSFDFEIFAYAPDGTRLPPFASNLSAASDLLQLPDGRVLASGLPAGQTGNADIGAFSVEGDYLGAFAEAGAGGGGALDTLSDGRVLAADPLADAVYVYGVVPVASEPESPEASGVGAVFPQPLARGAEASVEVTPEAPGVVRLRVFDSLGRLVAEAWPLASAGRQRLVVPTAGLAPGVYVVRVEGAGLAASRRVVIAG